MNDIEQRVKKVHQGDLSNERHRTTCQEGYRRTIEHQ